MFKSIFLILLILRTAWQISLELLNLHYSTNSKAEVPEILKDHFDQRDFERSKQYLKEKVTLKVISEVVQFFVTLYLILYGLARIERLFFEYSPFLQAIMLFGTVGLIFFVVNVIFKSYSVFVIETRYGFNTTKMKTFILDQMLTVALFTGFATIVVSILLWLLKHQIWWWQATIVAFGMILFFWFIQPIFIAPLFYKFSKIEDRELEEKIRELLNKSSMKVPNIFKVNASKRTKKQNAYLTGIGKSRRLVLYDTLLNYPTEEILAIVAHELGHHVRKHIPKDIVIFSSYAAIVLYLTNTVYQYISKTDAFGVQKPHTAFFYSFLFVSFVIYFFEPVMNYLSRKMEYEADTYSAQLMGSPVPLVNALKRLIKANLSNLNPLPLYKIWYYSHPAPEERINHLVSKISKNSA
ncbi:MAG: M48 family metallopeptidase [Pseudothermotoga sp.]